jgi:hypothetical protein
MKISNAKPTTGVAIVISVGKAPQSTDGMQNTKTTGVKIRGCGAATKGTTARGPMA